MYLPLKRQNITEAYSSAGRAAVSKTAGRGFEAFCAWNEVRDAEGFEGFDPLGRKGRMDAPGRVEPRPGKSKQDVCERRVKPSAPGTRQEAACDSMYGRYIRRY